MTKLRNINEKKCFDLLNEFVNSVNVDGNNPTLKEKKEHALAALSQLSVTAGKSDFIYNPNEVISPGCERQALALVP